MTTKNYDFKNDTAIKEYIEIKRKPGTIQTTTSYLKTFFRTIDKIPKEFLEQDEAQIKRDIKKYIAKKTHNAPKTLQTSLSIVKYFLEDKEIYLNERYWKNIRRNVKGNAVTQKQFFKKEDIKLLLQYTKTLEKAIIFTALTSGLRLNTILQLELQDIDFNSEPTEINVPAIITKNNKPHYTYLTKEATNALKLYLKDKDKYLQQSYIKTNKIPKAKDKKLIFPYASITIRQKWHRIINNAGYSKRDRTTNRYLVRFHSLKAYFKTQLLKADINPKIIDYLAEHQNQLDKTYINIDKEFVKEQYKKAEEQLSIFETTIQTSEIKEEIQKLKDENTHLKESLKLHDFILKQLTEHPEETEPKDAIKHLIKYNKKLTKAEEEIIKEKAEQNK